LPLLLTCLAVSLAVRLTVGLGVVSGLSMWPALSPGDKVLYLRCLGPQEGSLVVAELPGHGPIVKRVACVDQGRCFLLGDNRDNSYDSREYGFFPDSLIIGRVVVIRPHWPPAAPAAREGNPAPSTRTTEDSPSSDRARLPGR